MTYELEILFRANKTMLLVCTEKEKNEIKNAYSAFKNKESKLNSIKVKINFTTYLISLNDIVCISIKRIGE